MTGRTCATPGCGRLLAGHNASGVYRHHLHGEHCRCARCTGAAPPGAVPVVSTGPEGEDHPQRDGVQSVLVPVHSTFSGVNTRVRVSLYDTSAVEEPDV